MNPVEQRLSKPTRQSPVAVVFILLKFFRTSLRQFWPVLLVFFLQTQDKTELYIAISVLVIAGFNLLISLVSYFRYYFYVTEDQLVIEKGVLRQKKVNVPFDRIQTINFEQNFLHQILHVTSIKIDTAGSVGHELSIDAIDMELAEALRNYVFENKSEEALSQEETEPDAAGGPAPARRRMVLHLRPEDLLKVGVSQNHLRTLGLVLATFAGLINYIDEPDVMQRLFDKIIAFVPVNVENFWNVLLVSLPALLVFSILLSLFRTVLRFFDLKVWETEKGFQLVSGLFTRKEQAARFTKIQLFRWYTGPLKRIFHLFTVRLFQAASSEIQAAQAITIPGCYARDVDAMRNSIFSPEALAPMDSHRIDRRFVWRNGLYFGVMPAVAWVSGTIYPLGPYVLLGLLLIPLVFGALYRYWQRFSFHLNGHALRIRSGLILTRWEMLELYKVQAVEVQQSIYQRRKDLANVEIFTAAGSVSLPYLSLAKAQALQDYVLYVVESTERDWM